MNLNPCRQAFSAALMSCAVRSACLPLPAAAGTASAEAARAISHEQSSLDSSSERLTALTEAMRPRARSRRDRRRQPRGRARRHPRAASAPERLDFRTLDALPRTSGDAEWQCLAQAIYFESRGEPLEGQVAVAEVVLNRVQRPPLPRHRLRRHHAGRGLGARLPVLLRLRRQLGHDEERGPRATRREARHADARRPGAHRHRRRDLFPHPLGPPQLVAPDDAHRLDRAPPSSTAPAPRSRAAD